MTPAETLRAAADRLEALDKAATPGPWRDGDPGSDTPHIIAGPGGTSIAYCPDCNVNGALERPDAALILALRPAGTHLVPLLREFGDFLAWRAERGMREEDETAPDSQGGMFLAVARAILGEQS